MNSKKNIYELSKQIEKDQDKQYEIQAKKIVNAYRQVEQLKIPKNDVPVSAKASSSQHKVASSYALKVKQTLNEINANKVKQIESLSKNLIRKVDNKQRQRIPSKLQRAGVQKCIRVIETYNEKISIWALNQLISFKKEEDKKEDYFILKFKVFKIFRAWKDETVFSKIQRQKNGQEKEMQLLKKNQLASEFHAFILIKKSFKIWNAEVKKEMRRKKYELEQKKRQVEQKLKLQQQLKRSPNNVIPAISELQNKVRGFLDGLKQKITNKDRLNTIKQKTEESDLRIKISEQSEALIELKQNQHDCRNSQDQDNQIGSNQARKGNSEIIILPPEPIAEKKPMTNQQLQKKRKELQIKHKSRKQILEKLKKEKEQKKKEEEKQRVDIQKQIELQQKKIKQEKYRQYKKNKQDNEEWEKREIVLEKQAEQFNRFRLLKYYGWKPLSQLKIIKNKNGEYLYRTLLLIVYRINAQKFIINLESTAASILENQYERMNKRYRLRLLTKGLTAMQQWRKEQIQKKQQYTIRHEVNRLKIYFAEWNRTIPQLVAENFDWERPRNKRAIQFNRLQLLHKFFRSLCLNKEQQQKNRCIADQKTKIKTKIKNMLEDSGEINYDQFL